MQKNYCFFDFTCYNTCKSGVVLVNGCTLVFREQILPISALFLFLLIIQILEIKSIDFMYEPIYFLPYITKEKQPENKLLFLL